MKFSNLIIMYFMNHKTSALRTLLFEIFNKNLNYTENYSTLESIYTNYACLTRLIRPWRACGSLWFKIFPIFAKMGWRSEEYFGHPWAFAFSVLTNSRPSFKQPLMQFVESEQPINLLKIWLTNAWDSFKMIFSQLLAALTLTPFFDRIAAMFGGFSCREWNNYTMN